MGFIKRFGKKHLCSRFHSRFGDTSITAPDNGSWNQRPALDTNGFAELDALSCADGHSMPEYVSKSKNSSVSDLVARLCLRDPGFQESSSDLGARPSEPNRGRQRYQSRGRGGSDDERPGDERHERGPDESGSSRPETANGHRSRGPRPITPARHFREEIPPSQNLGPSDRTAVTERNSQSDYSAEATESPRGELPRRPPLSITSRMRSWSPPSTSKEPTLSSRQTTGSSGATASSNRTSPTMSSSSMPSVYPQSPELMKVPYKPSFQKKRKIRAPQELVPSYDELYC